MKKLFAGLTAAALALFMTAPLAEAADGITVCSNVGNGVGSKNFVLCKVGGYGHHDHDGEPNIKQKNVFVGGPTVVIVGQNTGDNTVKNNTGGDSGVISGNAKVKIGIWTTANSNVVN